MMNNFERGVWELHNEKAREAISGPIFLLIELRSFAGKYEHGGGPRRGHQSGAANFFFRRRSF